MLEFIPYPDHEIGIRENNLIKILLYAYMYIEQRKSLYAISINHVHLSTLMNELPNGIPHLPTLPKISLVVSSSVGDTADN